MGLGARKGKYGKDGRVNPLPGSNIPMATLGTFVLWMGWYGFNGGSVLALGDAASAIEMSNVMVNTNMAACGGVIPARFQGNIKAAAMKRSGFFINYHYCGFYLQKAEYMDAHPINRCNLPPWAIASRAYNRNPQPIEIQGVRCAGKTLFSKLDPRPFDRYDLYEVVPMFEAVIDALGSNDGEVLQKMEEVLNNEVPAFVSSQVGLFENPLLSPEFYSFRMQWNLDSLQPFLHIQIFGDRMNLAHLLHPFWAEQ